MSTKRILAGLVALLMTLAVLPVAVFADSLGEYAPIATMEELVEGDYVIYGVNGNYTGIMNNTISGGRPKASNPTFNGSNIVVTDNTVIWHIAYVEGSGYTLYNAAIAKYCEIVSASGTAGFAFNDTASYYYTIEANEDGSFDIYNPNMNNRAICLYQTDFRDYILDSSTYNPVHLYKYVEEAGDTCSAPAANPVAGTVRYGQAVSLICTTADATIYYSVDDGDTYNEYTGPFYLTADTTVYAYATASGMSDSAVVTFEYVVEDEIANVTVAEARALDNNTYTKVTGIVTFIDGKNVYVEDPTGGICLYFLYADDPTLAQIAIGDEVTAIGMKTTYKGLYELSNVVGGNPYWVSINSTGNALPVQNVTLADLVADPDSYQCERVFIENVELGVINYSGNTPVSDGTNTINAYRLPELTGIGDYDIVNMYAVIGWYDAAQLRVQYASDVTLVANMQTLTIYYQYEDGTEAAPTYENGFAQGESYSVTSPEINGYLPSIAVVAGVMGAEDITVTVTYTPDATVPTHMLTINYQYEDGTAAAETYTAELYENDTYSVTSPVIEGYTADTLVVAGTMGAYDVNVTVTYTAIPAAEATNYKLVTDASELVEGKQYIIVGVNEDSYYMMGYQRTNNRGAIAAVVNADGTITATPAIVASDETAPFELTLGYDADLGGYTFLDPINGGYLYAAGASANYLRTQAVNDVNGAWAITFEDGVTSITAPGSSNRNVMQYNSGSTLFSCYASASQKPVYLYVEFEGEVPQPTYYTLTVNYQFEDGTEAAPAYVETLVEGASYSVESPAVEGFVPDQAVVTGTMTGDVTVVVTYTPAPVVETNTYRLVTSADQLVAGKQYIIVGSDGDVRYMMGYQRTNNRGAIQVTINADGTISAAPAVDAADETAPFEFTLGYDADLGGYTFYDAVTGGYLYAAGSSSNWLRTQAENDVNGAWTITFPGDDVASIVAEGSSNRNVMQYNSGSNIFSCYASASQKAVYIYEKVEGDEPQVMLGDVDCDGEVTFSDISLLAQYLNGQAELSELGTLNADMDQNGEVTFADVGAIYQFLVG